MVSQPSINAEEERNDQFIENRETVENNSGNEDAPREEEDSPQPPTELDEAADEPQNEDSFKESENPFNISPDRTGKA